MSDKSIGTLRDEEDEAVDIGVTKLISAGQIKFYLAGIVVIVVVIIDAVAKHLK